MDAAAVAQAAESVGRLVLPRLIGGASERIKTSIQRWDFVRGLDRFQRIRRIKPIWNPGKEAALDEFYYPCLVASGNRSHTVADLEDLGATRSVIVGRVGQGKSMLIRFVASNELSALMTGDAEAVIPLYLELRHLARGDLISTFVQRSMTEMGLHCDDKVFDHLAETKRLTLFLDGFDEIAPRSQQKALVDLERLTVRLPTLGIVITSRPGVSGIEHLAGFKTHRLLDLDDQTKAGLIRKQYLPTQGDVAERLIRELAASPLSQLTTTPLMAILCVIHYNTYQKLPKKVSDFHEDIFDALLRRHDATKPGFTRPRASKMDDYTFRAWFDRFAFYAMKSERAAWNRYEMLQLAQGALPKRGFTNSADEVLADAVGITGLLCEEGGEYRFIHKSIMEYHAASCVKGLGDKFARRFYELMHAAGRWHWWEETLRFLQVVDRSRYLRFFELAQLRDFAKAPSLFRLLPGCAYGAYTKTITAQPNWLLESYGRTGQLLSRLGGYFSIQAATLRYSASAESTLRKKDVDAAEDEPAVAAELSSFVQWCHGRIETLEGEIEDLDDADELLDMGDSEDWLS